MKKTLVLILSLLVVLTVTACQSSQTSSDSSKSPNNNSTSSGNTSNSSKGGTDNSTPVSGGTLKIALGSEPTTLDPYVWPSNNDRNVFIQIFNSLMEYDPKTLEPSPGLVQKADISNDGLTYTLHLQPNVTFHNGQKMTAKDVKYSIEKAMAPAATRTQPLLAPIQTINIIDDNTVELKLKERDSLLLDSLIEVFVTPDDPSIDQSKHPIGTGPFKFSTWNRNEKIVLTKNENYWRKGLPYLNELDFLPVPDAEVKTLQLLNGQVDFIDIVPTSKVQQLQANKDVQLARVDDKVTTASHIMLINNSNPEFNQKFRQALNYAIDRKKIKNALFGNFTVRSSSIPSGNQNYNSNSPVYNLDVNKAKQLLKESGYNGQKVELLYHKIDPMYDIVAQITAESLKNIGVNVDLKGVEIAQWTDNVFNKKQYQLALTATLPKPNPYAMLSHVYSETNGASLQWDDKAWYEKLASYPTLPTADGKKVLDELQNEVLQQSPEIVLGGYIQSSGLTSHVHGFIANPVAKFEFEKVWKDK